MWLIDTNVISELGRPRPQERVTAFFASIAVESVFVSSITVAELRHGIEIMVNEDRQAAQSIWFDQIVTPLIEDRVIGIGVPEALAWRRLLRLGRAINHTFAQPDLFIAATAMVHSLTIVTRNVADFEKTGATLFNPFTGETFSGG